MNTNPNEKAKLTKSKRNALRLLLVLITMLVALLVLNSIDFDAFSKDKDPQFIEMGGTDRVLGDHHFATPDYDQNILLDKDYLSKDRGMYYTYGNETYYIDNNYSDYDRFCVFFGEYFDALVNGDEKKVNSMLTASFISENGLYDDFTMQKIYSRRVTLKSHTIIEEGEYYGYTRATFEVIYKILDNDGTFRRDIMYDEERPLIFELLEKNGTVRINSVGRYRYLVENENRTPMITYIIPLVSGFILIVSLVASAITASLYPISIALASFFSFLSAMAGAKIHVQIILLVILSSLFITLSIIFYKKKKARSRVCDDAQNGGETDKTGENESPDESDKDNTQNIPND